MRRLLASLACVGCALAASCSLTTSLDGLSGGSAATTSDAGNAGDASTGSADAMTVATPEGGGPNAACATATFCADFDSVATPADGWDAPKVDQPGLLSLDSTKSVSPPRALRAFTPQGQSKSVFVSKMLAAPANTIHVELSVQIAEAGSNGGVMFMALTQFNGSIERNVVIYRDGDRTFVQDEQNGADVRQFDFSAQLVEGRWYRIGLDLDVETSETFIAVTLDGAPAVPRSGLKHEWKLLPFELAVGVVNLYESTTTWDIRIDDVVVKASPK